METFPYYWPFVRGIHWSPLNSPHKGQWRGTLMFPLICAWTIGWVDNREAGDLGRHRAHYDVTVTVWLHLPLPYCQMEKCLYIYAYMYINTYIYVYVYTKSIYACATKFDYLLYWDITGAPCHIAGQALFCVNIGNGLNNVCNNRFNYNYLYWIKLRVIWRNSGFEPQIYQVTYKILVLLYYTLFRRWDLFRDSCLQVLATGWVGPTVLRGREELGR